MAFTNEVEFRASPGPREIVLGPRDIDPDRLLEESRCDGAG
jgi:hypothetical protein